MTEHRSETEGSGGRDRDEHERHEELLRRVLRAEAEGVAIDQGALERIRARTMSAPRSRRSRRYLRPALALGTAAAVAVGGTLLGLQLTGDDTAVLKTPRFAQGGGSPQPSDSAVPTTSPSPTQSQPAPPVTAAGPVVAIWPYQTDAYAAQLAAKHQPWMSDPQQVALRFVGSYLGQPAVDKVVSVSSSADIPNVVLGKTGANGTTVPVTTVALIQERGVYGVVEATAAGLAITAPEQKATVGSPLTVKGTIVGVDEGICAYLKPASTAATAKSCVSGGGGLGGAPPGDWTATLHFAASGQRSAALVASTDDASGAPGPTRLVARLVVLATRVALPPSPGSVGSPASFVGVHDGRIAVFSAKDGTLVRYLTDRQPSGGDSAPTVSSDGQTVYFLRRTNPCPSTADGSAPTSCPPPPGGPCVRAGRVYVVPADGSAPALAIGGIASGDVISVAVSHDQRSLAYVSQSCATGGQSLLVQPLTGDPHTIARFPAQPPEFTSAPSFAADDQLVAIGEGTNTANRYVRIYPVSGSAQATAPCVGGDPCRATHPAYDASGALTYVVDHGPSDATVVRTTNGKASTLFALPGTVDQLSSLDVSPAGDVIIGSAAGTYRWSSGTLRKIAADDLQPAW